MLLCNGIKPPHLTTIFGFHNLFPKCKTHSVLVAIGGTKSNITEIKIQIQNRTIMHNFAIMQRKHRYAFSQRKHTLIKFENGFELVSLFGIKQFDI